MAQTELYNKSPYVIGARKWNSLPNDFQIPDDIISYVDNCYIGFS